MLRGKRPSGLRGWPSGEAAKADVPPHRAQAARPGPTATAPCARALHAWADRTAAHMKGEQSLIGEYTGEIDEVVIGQQRRVRAIHPTPSRFAHVHVHRRSAAELDVGERRVEERDGIEAEDSGP